MNRNLTTDLCNHALKSLTRSALCEVCSSVSNHLLNLVCPLYRSSKLCNEVFLNLGRASVRLCVNVLINRADRSLKFSGIDCCLKLLLCRLHEGRVECATNLELEGTLCTGLEHLGASSVDASHRTGDYHLSRAVVVGGSHHVVNRSADFLNLLVGQSKHGGHCRWGDFASLLHSHSTGCNELQSLLK